MQCIHCGYQLSAFDTICPRCKKSQSDPVAPPAPPAPAAYTPPPQPQGYRPAPPPVYGGQPIQYNDDGPDTGFALLGFFIPIVGLILYFVTKDRQPMKAGSALKGALWGFGSGIIVPFVIVMLLALLGGRVPNTPNGTNQPVTTTQSGLTEQQELEASLPAEITAEIANQKKSNIACTSVTLTETSKGNYDGVATFADGSTAPLKVTATLNGPIWQILPQ